MTVVYGTMSSKGGAGKSTIAKIIAGEYATNGKKVLLVDSDPSQNMQAWWLQSGEKGNQPENVEFMTALKTNTLDDLMRRKDEYDAIIIDTAGRDSVILSNILNYVDVIITPVQPAKREIDAMTRAIEIVAEHNETATAKVKHLIVRTRITAINHKSAEYRFIRPYIEAVREAGFHSILMDAELLERNVYREIENGYGTVQMQELTDAVKKSRMEIMALMMEIEKHVGAIMKEAA